jgi:Polyketide cyclase / dehydrase and lipid transport
MPNTVYISHVIDAPIEQVWSVMRDFNDMPSYHPNIKKSIIEGNCPSDQVGCVRRLTLAEGFVRERLLCLDDEHHIFTYAIIEGTLPVRSYVAGVRLHRVTERNRTFAEWWADFEVVGIDRDTMIAQIGNGVFAAGFSAVAAKLAAGVNQGAANT